MSQWNKYLPIQPVYFAFILILTYYSVYFPTVFSLGSLSFAFLCVFRENGWKTTGRLFLIVLVFATYMGGRVLWVGHRDKTAPHQISQIQLLPDTISINGDSLSFRGRSDHRLYQVFYKLKTEEEQTYFKQVTHPLQLTVEAEVSEASNQRNFNGFDYQAYLSTQEIDQLVEIGTIKGITTFKTLNLFDVLSTWRRQAIVAIKRDFPSPMQHYMTGLLLGHLDKDFSEMNDLYSSLGIIHLFALSGMQVGFFIGKFRWCLLRLGIKRETVNWLQLPFSVVYAGLTGFSASVIRSLIQKALGNQGISGMENFAITVMISFIIMPNFLLTAGGVLSFAYALILTMMDVTQVTGWRRVVAESGTISLGILPLLIWYFSTFQPLSIILTFIFSLVFDLILLPLLSLVFLISPIVKFDLLNPLFERLEDLIHWVASWTGRPIVLGRPALWSLLLLLIVLALLYDFWKHRRLRLILGLVVLTLFLQIKHPLVNEITMIDVGQGDSIFLRDMKGRTVLIDVGGRVTFSPAESWQQRHSSSQASKTSIPYLQSRGVSKIDYLILTHTEV